MKFVDGPLDGQVTPHNPEDSPERLYVRMTGKGFARWAYMFLAGEKGRETEFMACEDDFDPLKLWIYVKVQGEYRLEKTPRRRRWR